VTGDLPAAAASALGTLAKTQHRRRLRAYRLDILTRVDRRRIPSYYESITETEALLGLRDQGNERLPLNPPLPPKRRRPGSKGKFI